MKTISKPTDNARDVFLECISTVKNSTLKKQYEDCADLVEMAESEFERKFLTNQIYLIPQKSNVLGPIGKEEMKRVYDYRMVKQEMPGNKYYNLIKSSAPYGKCPLCSVRGVDTLDHYLPKSKYPVFAVTPVNLIPACAPCNKGKLIDYPKNSHEQTLHPYYDNVESESWIKAKILHSNPICFEYYVDCPSTWSQILTARAQYHFESFHLNELFTSHANEEFIGIKRHLIKLFNDHPDILYYHLKDSYESRIELGINSWQAVMYDALLNDRWFITGGVLI